MWLKICSLFAVNFPYIAWFEPVLYQIQQTTGLYAFEAFLIVMAVVSGLAYTAYTIIRDLWLETHLL